MIMDYRDSNGIQRRVLVPHDGIPPEEGIPLSLPLDRLYGHMPIAWQVHLVDALFARGLIEPKDFFRPGAPELAQRAILDTCKHDALDMISLAKSLVE